MKKATKAPKGVKETVDKIKETVATKVPAWLKRVKSELAKLAVLIEKVNAQIEKFEALLALGKLARKDKESLRLLRKQAKAMNAYKAVLEERIAKA